MSDGMMMRRGSSGGDAIEPLAAIYKVHRAPSASEYLWNLGDGASPSASTLQAMFGGPGDWLEIRNVGAAIGFANTSFSGVSMNGATSTIYDGAFAGNTNLVSAQGASVSDISESAFSGCTSLRSALFPNTLSVDHSAFANCTNLDEASFPAATYIGDAAFMNCSLMSAVSLDSTGRFGVSAFSNCSALQSLIMPNLTSIDFPTASSSFATFAGCTAMQMVSMPKLSEIRDVRNLFSASPNLREVYLPALSSCTQSGMNHTYMFGNPAFIDILDMRSWPDRPCAQAAASSSRYSAWQIPFSSMTSLQELSIGLSNTESVRTLLRVPTLSKLRETNMSAMIASQFSHCTDLTSCYLDKVQIVTASAFIGRQKLREVFLPVCSSIEPSAFASCPNLSAVHLMNANTVCEFGAGAFGGTTVRSNITVYVPSGIAEAQKASYSDMASEAGVALAFEDLATAKAGW